MRHVGGMNREARRGRLAAVAAAIVVFPFMLGCNNDPPPPELGTSVVLVTDTDAAGGYGTCSPDGSTRPCRRFVSEHAGVVTCIMGTQTCAGGVWTACGATSNSAIATFTRGNFTPATAQDTPGAIARPLPPPVLLRLPAGTNPAAAHKTLVPGPAQ
jgi:hypothetical protein